MKFDFTDGKEATYLVCECRWNGHDQYYVSSMKRAKCLFEALKKMEHVGAVSISIYDLKKDVRKEYVRL